MPLHNDPLLFLRPRVNFSGNNFFTLSLSYKRTPACIKARWTRVKKEGFIRGGIPSYDTAFWYNKKKKKKLREEGEGRLDRKERPCLFDRAALEWFIRVEEK